MRTASNAYNPQPPKEISAAVADVINAGKALTTLLHQEAMFMDAMRVSEAGELQERKLKLTGLMERYGQYLAKHPEVMQSATEQEKSELRSTIATFNGVMKKNYDTLLVARAVNRAVVKCVTQIVTKKDQNHIYNSRGAMRSRQQLPISVTLNQTI